MPTLLQKRHVCLPLILVLLFSGSCKKENGIKPKYYFAITVDGKSISIENERLSTSGEDYAIGGIADSSIVIVARKYCQGVNPECFELSLNFNGTTEGSFDMVNLNLWMVQDSIDYDYRIQPTPDNQMGAAIVQVIDIERSHTTGQVGAISGKLTGTAWDTNGPNLIPITIEFRVPETFY